ncbi:MAG TPA: hypothetical protein VF756_04055 [Thermoanaerobaculia bacterium]
MTTTTTECPTCPETSFRLRVSALTFALSYIAAIAMQEIFTLRGLPALAVSLLPAAGFTFFILEEVKLIRSLDELHRQIQLEALAIGFLTAMLLLMTLGFLQRVDLLPHALSTIRDVWGVLPVCYAIGMLFARRRYL